MIRPVSIGIDLGGTVIKMVALDQDGTVLARRRSPTNAHERRDELVGRLAALVDDIRQEIAGLMSNAPMGSAGLAVPGVVDAAAGRVEFTVALNTDWNGFEAVPALEDSLGLPTVLMNDAHAATVGEQMDGGGRGYRDFACVTVGTGIGGGLVLDGRLYYGSRGMSGVLGHTTVLPDGPDCLCGNQGCLEVVASGAAIARAARARLGDTLTRTANDDWFSPRAVAEAARAGNQTAREIYAEAGRYLGIALASLVCTLNPSAIVVGGGVSQAGDLLLDSTKAEIKRRTAVFSEERGGIALVQSPLGSDAGALGAARWSTLAGQGVSRA